MPHTTMRATGSRDGEIHPINPVLFTHQTFIPAARHCCHPHGGPFTLHVAETPSAARGEIERLKQFSVRFRFHRVLRVIVAHFFTMKMCLPDTDTIRKEAFSSMTSPEHS